MKEMRYTREYWTIYREKSFLVVVWLGFTPTRSFSPASKLDRRHTGRLRKRGNLPRKPGPLPIIQYFLRHTQSSFPRMLCLGRIPNIHRPHRGFLVEKLYINYGLSIYIKKEKIQKTTLKKEVFPGLGFPARPPRNMTKFCKWPASIFKLHDI